MYELILQPQTWISFVTLTVMEIVLGIDNIVFISLLVARLKEPQATTARRVGLSLALVMRVALLLVLTWIIALTQPLFFLLDHPVSWRDLILLAGGLFLLWKGTREIHLEIEGGDDEGRSPGAATFAAIIAQIVVIDMVFSVDSIITAIGIAEHVEVMIAAVVISIVVMYVASSPISAFIAKHPTTKMLALSFLILIGAALVADGVGFHIPRGYIYFSMAFAAGVEAVNILARRRRRA
jgi:predicted tellurium resistance membrane protein TerC